MVEILRRMATIVFDEIQADFTLVDIDDTQDDITVWLTFRDADGYGPNSVKYGMAHTEAQNFRIGDKGIFAARSQATSGHYIDGGGDSVLPLEEDLDDDVDWDADDDYYVGIPPYTDESTDDYLEDSVRIDVTGKFSPEKADQLVNQLRDAVALELAKGLETAKVRATYQLVDEVVEEETETPY